MVFIRLNQQFKKPLSTNMSFWISPRSYTIEAIQEVLGFDYSFIFEKTFVVGKFDEIWGIKKNKFTESINIAWIFGIIYFIIGFIEMYTEYNRVVRSEIAFENLVYIIVKLCSIISFTLFIRGFIVVGNMHKIELLQIVGFIILISYFLFGLYAVFSLCYIEYSFYSFYKSSNSWRIKYFTWGGFN